MTYGIGHWLHLVPQERGVAACRQSSEWWSTKRSGWLAGGAGNAAARSPTIPTFVLPYKRFVTPCLISRAADYFNQAGATYRRIVRHERCLIGYEPDESGHQPTVCHTRIWRLLGWLGGLTGSLVTAREQLLKGDPNSLCHRIDGSVIPHKARSHERLATLETARQLLLIAPQWEQRFDRPFFPQFATRAGFG